MFAALHGTWRRRLAGQPYIDATSGRSLKLSPDGASTATGGRAPRRSSHTLDSLGMRQCMTITQGRGVKASERPFSEAQRAIKWRTGPAWFWQDGPWAGAMGDV
jgi:hypothetical protein